MSRKRSRQVGLILLASTTLVLGGCEQPTETRTYTETSDNTTESPLFKTLADCERLYSTQECKDYSLAAEMEHERTAPKFTSLKECEEKYGVGACGQPRSPSTTQASGSNVFMPMMLGYMMGSMMSKPAPVYYGAPDRDDRRNGGGGGSAAANRPIYSGSSYVGSSSSGGSVQTPASSAFSSRPASAVSAPSAATTARGGFGSSVSAHGSSAS